MDRQKDGLIHCFKEEQPYSLGLEMLKKQLPILNEPERNPFEKEIILHYEVEYDICVTKTVIAILILDRLH